MSFHNCPWKDFQNCSQWTFTASIACACWLKKGWIWGQTAKCGLAQPFVLGKGSWGTRANHGEKLARCRCPWRPFFGRVFKVSKYFFGGCLAEYASCLEHFPTNFHRYSCLKSLFAGNVDLRIYANSLASFPNNFHRFSCLKLVCFDR